MQTEIGKAALAYRVWRRNKQSRGVAAPVELQRQIVKLLEGHSWEEVCRTVGISKSALANWRQKHREYLQLNRRGRAVKPQQPSGRRASSAAKPTAQAFIELPVAPASTLAAELRLPSGAVVAARAASDGAALGELFSRIIVSTRAFEAER